MQVGMNNFLKKPISRLLVNFLVFLMVFQGAPYLGDCQEL